MKGRYEFNDAEHVHTLDGKPLTGTSSVLSIVAKPLTWWASGLAVATLGWTPKTTYVNGKPRTLPRGPRIEAAYKAWDGITLEASAFEGDSQSIGNFWLELLDTAYAAHSKSLAKSATKGKDLHAALEKYVKYCIAKNEGAPANVKSDDIQQFIEWSIENVETFLWSEMHTMSETLWLGGITDSGAKLKDGRIAIIDFKSSKEAYKNQFWQCAGYALQIEEAGGFKRDGEQVMSPITPNCYIVIPFGAKEFTVAIHDDVVPDKVAFKAALTLYRANQDE